MKILAAAAALALAALAPAAALEADSGFSMEGSGYVLQDGPPSGISMSLELDTAAGSGAAVPFSLSGTVSSKAAYSVASSDAASMRDGRYLRISAGLESASGAGADLGALGRLVGQEGGHSVYVFSGRLTEGGQTHRTAWVARVWQDPSAAPPAEADHTARITPAPGFDPAQLIITLGQTVAFENGDDRTHRLVSGTVTNERNPGSGVPCTTAETPADFMRVKIGKTGGCSVVHDGRTDFDVRPGGAASVTFSEPGTHRFVDPADPRLRMLVIVLAS